MVYLRAREKVVDKRTGWNGNEASQEERQAPMDEWDEYEEDGPLDLEDQLERAMDRAGLGKTSSEKDG